MLKRVELSLYSDHLITALNSTWILDEGSHFRFNEAVLIPSRNSDRSIENVYEMGLLRDGLGGPRSCLPTRKYIYICIYMYVHVT